MEDLLYRGINQQQYELLLDTQILKPKGDEFAMVHVADGTFKYDRLAINIKKPVNTFPMLTG